MDAKTKKQVAASLRAAASTLAAGPPDLRFRGQGNDQPRFRHLEVGDVFYWSGRQVEVKSVEVKPTFVGKQVTIKTTNGQTITMSDATMVEGLRKRA